jgi:hypothetical protein
MDGVNKKHSRCFVTSIKATKLSVTLRFAMKLARVLCVDHTSRWIGICNVISPCHWDYLVLRRLAGFATGKKNHRMAVVFNVSGLFIYPAWLNRLTLLRSNACFFY